jgi:hypothetical protein
LINGPALPSDGDATHCPTKEYIVIDSIRYSTVTMQPTVIVTLVKSSGFFISEMIGIVPGQPVLLAKIALAAVIPAAKLGYDMATKPSS